MAGFWSCELSDGRQFHEFSPELQVEDRPPWRELERVVQAEGVKVLWVKADLATRYVMLQADGYPIETGRHYTVEMGIGLPVRRFRFYRWIVRTEETRKLWAIVSEEGAWQIESPLSQVQMPDPHEVLQQMAEADAKAEGH